MPTAVLPGAGGTSAAVLPDFPASASGNSSSADTVGLTHLAGVPKSLVVAAAAASAGGSAAATAVAMALMVNSSSNGFSLDSGGAGVSEVLPSAPRSRSALSSDTQQHRPLSLPLSHPPPMDAEGDTAVGPTPSDPSSPPQQHRAGFSHTGPSAESAASLSKPPISPWQQRHSFSAAAAAAEAGGGDPAEELVEVQGMSDVRFVQGLVNGTIVAHVCEEALPTREAFDLVSRCLREDPALRPSAAEVVDHCFFLM